MRHAIRGGVVAQCDRVAGLNVFQQDDLGQLVLDVLLYGALERPGAKLHVVALGGDVILGLGGELEVVAEAVDAAIEVAELDVDDAVDGLFFKRIEHDHVVHAVEELGGEGALEGLTDDATRIIAVDLRARGLGMEPDATAEVLQLAGADVGGHDQDRVFEVDLPAEAVGQATFVEHLQQQIEDVRMGLFDLVKQDDGVGFAAHLLGQLAALFVTDVARRRADEAGDGELFEVLAHVDTDQRVVGVEKELGEFLGQMRLADARGAEEHEGADGLVGIFQPDTVAADGLDDLGHGLVLTDDLLLQEGVHVAELDVLSRGNTLHGYAGHHGHDFGHLIGVDRLTVRLHLLLPTAFCLVEQLEILPLCIAIACGQLEVLRLDGGQFGVLRLLDLRLQRLDVLRHNHVGDVHPRSGFVQCVDGFVGEVAIADVALGQFDARLECGVGVDHIVVLLVAPLDVLEDLECLLGRRRVDDHLLETAL